MHIDHIHAQNYSSTAKSENQHNFSQSAGNRGLNPCQRLKFPFLVVSYNLCTGLLLSVCLETSTFGAETFLLYDRYGINASAEILEN